MRVTEATFMMQDKPTKPEQPLEDPLTTPFVRCFALMPHDLDLALCNQVEEETIY